jgi:hypothetical protein
VTKSTSQELVALLLNEARVDPARLDEALHRQVVNGGALDTVLMEMGLVSEEDVLALLARASSLPAVAKEQLTSIDSGLISIFPRRVAERHLMIPFERTGRRLSVAVSTLPKLEDLDSIGFMLSVWIRPFITTEVRLAHALNRAYGIAVPRRLEGLLGLLGEDAEDETTAPSSDPTSSQAASAENRASHASSSSSPRPRARDEVVAKKPVTASSTNDPPPMTHAGPTASAEWGVKRTSAIDAPLSAAPALRATAASSLLVGGQADTHTAPDHSRPEESLAKSTVAEQQAARDLLRKIDEEALQVEKKKRARLEQRVRWTVDDAIAELAMAEDRDSFVDVILRFAHRRLSSVAMFVLTKGTSGPHFEGWDAIDDVWSFRDLSEIHIPTTGDHVLAKLHDMKSPFLGPIDANDPLMSALGRRPRAAILVPVFVGQRLAAVLYGDCGPQSIPPSSLAELHMVVPRFGNALRNLIVRQKQAASGNGKTVDTDRVLPAATVTGAIPVIELDIGDFDEISSEAVVDKDASDIALDHMALASGGSFSAPPIPADDIVIDVDDDRPPPLPHHRPPPLPKHRPPPLPKRKPVDVGPPAAAAPDGEVTDRHPAPGNGALGPVTITGSGAVVSLDQDQFESVDGEDGSTPLPAELAEFDDDTGTGDDEISTDEGSTLAELRRRRAAEQIEADVRATASLALAPLDTTKSSPLTSSGDSTSAASTSSDVASSESDETSAVDDEKLPESDETSAVDDEKLPTNDQKSTLGDEESSVGDEKSTEDDVALPVDATPEHDSALPTPRESASEAQPIASTSTGLARPTLAEFADLADDTLQPVASPGAQAREALLIATHTAWLAHVDEDADALLLGLQAPGESGRATIGRIAALGDRAMPALARYFPGVLVEHPFSSMSTRPEARDLSDALACLIRIGVERAAPILVAEVTHEDRLHRYAAVLGLSELIVPAALPRLAERVFDPEFRIALLALEVLPHYGSSPGYERVQAQLRDLIRRGDDFQRRRAIVAATELHDRDAIPTLADVLGTRPKEISDEAHRALIEITKRDLGTSTRRWRAWFDDNSKVRRMEWLLQGLLQKETDIRRSAQTELNRLTGKYFGYRYDAPRSERDSAVLVWQRWWAEEADQSAWQ